MTQRRKLVAANWKMNGSIAANARWLETYRAGARRVRCDVVVCPPFPFLAQLYDGLRGTGAEYGGQDLSAHSAGAHTGDVAGEMLVDVGSRWVIVGHSERRQRHGETNDLVALKVERALDAGLRPIVCIGETLAERESGATQRVVEAQLAAVLSRVGAAAVARGAIAYEPVWAIGTGRTATPEQAQEVHAAIRAQVSRDSAEAATATRILYGGSVKPSNAAELFACTDIDGGLIGGASLVGDDFLAICIAASRN